MSEKEKLSSISDEQLLNGILGFVINVTARSMRMALEEALKEYEVTPTQWILMKGLHEHGEANQSDLSQMLFLDNATITRQIDKLEQMSFLKRKRQVGDRRVQMVSLTTKGKRRLPKLDEIAMSISRNAMLGMKDKDIETMMSGLDVVQNNLMKNGHRNGEERR